MDRRGYLIAGSLKQLLRTPMKTALFFLLIMAASLLLVFSGAMLSETSRLISAAENEFVTLGTVEQVRDSNGTRPLWNTCMEETEMLDVSIYQDIYGPDILDFEGAGYVQKPEMRPYYMAYLPDYMISSSHSPGFGVVSEFTVLEQLDGKRYKIRLERSLYEFKVSSVMDRRIYSMLSEGSEVPLCTHNQYVRQDLEVGKRYIGAIKFDQYSEQGAWDAESLVLFTGPFYTQVDASTKLAAESQAVPMAGNLYREDGAWSYSCTDYNWTATSRFPETVYADEVTDGFYDEGGRGRIWLEWAQGIERVLRLEKYFSVIPTGSLDLLPSFHDRAAVLKEGRAITDGEFSSGARVCLVSRHFLNRNFLKIGDSLPLSLMYSMYGECISYDSSGGFAGAFSPLSAEGRLYEPFWEAEYEIVGAYDMPFNEDFKNALSTGKDIQADSIIIPARSVEATDKDNIAYYAPMNARTASFIIPNGSIEEFDRKLHEAVPEAAKLNISYNDNGYSEVRESLDNARLSGMLLLIAALAAALAILALLMYFFVVKEKKRTAIERSLGMTKAQCRVSILSGVLILALGASILGSAGGAAVMERADFSVREQEEMGSEYDLTYSVWANAQDAVELKADISTPWAVYAAVPLGITLLTAVLAVMLVDRSLRIEPIYLLSVRGEG